MKRTPRGFAVFTEFIDGYRNEVRVQESSSAEGRFVWVFCKPAEGSMFEEHEKSPAPHLTPAQARRVAKALLRFADGAK